MCHPGMALNGPEKRELGEKKKSKTDREVPVAQCLKISPKSIIEKN